MEKYSEGPYHLTLKSNGCLILISALTPSHLLVASKHSLGTTTEEDIAKAAAVGIEDTKGKKATRGSAEDGTEAEDRTHAAVGREWVKRTLKAKGKTEAELARRLWDQNLSAVLEVSQSREPPWNAKLKSSSVTIASKNMSLQPQSTGQVFTYTV